LPLNLAFSTSCTVRPEENRLTQPASWTPFKPELPARLRTPELLLAGGANA
jgi:hypothetical protein